jgi:hypothetical protein
LTEREERGDGLFPDVHVEYVLQLYVLNDLISFQGDLVRKCSACLAQVDRGAKNRLGSGAVLSFIQQRPEGFVFDVVAEIHDRATHCCG